MVSQLLVFLRLRSGREDLIYPLLEFLFLFKRQSMLSKKIIFWICRRAWAVKRFRGRGPIFLTHFYKYLNSKQF